MGTDHRRGEEDFGDEIAIADGVNRVRRDRVETERALEQDARDGIGAAGHGSGAERKHRGRLRGGAQARAIALEWPEVREEPMRPRHGDRSLHVCVRRHEGRLERLGLLEQHALQHAHAVIEPLAELHRPEASRGRDLIVATPPRVQLAGDLADLFVQQAVDHRVHVLVGRTDRLARSQACAYGVQPALQRLALVE